MPDFAAPVERLIDELKHLPGIGQKTAQRLAFHILRATPEDALALAEAIRTRIGQTSLAFYDAIAPIVAVESVNTDIAFRASRWDKEIATR